MHFLKLKRNFGQDNLIELINNDEQKDSDRFILKILNIKIFNNFFEKHFYKQ